jgi:hypothetical protein
MKKYKTLRVISFILIGLVVVNSVISINGCAPSKAVAAKSGAQLWAENCQRCHNTPSPASFSSEQWKTIGMHMQSRALITESEKEKIVAFLQTSK